LKNFFLIVIILLTRFAGASGTIEQEIRYKCDGAEEVFIVWGVNNWQLLPENQLPQGSFIKDKLIYTAMSGNDGNFSVQLPLPEGTKIDYVFWITKGPFKKGTDVWDLNAPKKDFHSLVQSGTVTMVESKLKIRPLENISVVDFAYGFLVFSLLLFFIIKHALRSRQKPEARIKPYLTVAATSITLCFYLLLIRPSVVGNSWDLLIAPGKNIGGMLWAGVYDVWYVLALSLIFSLIIYATKKYQAAQKTVTLLFLFNCLLTLLLSIFNIRIVDALGKPFNYQWLYYSDFLNSPDAKAAISANISSGEMWRVAALTVSAVFMTWVVMKLVAAIHNRRIMYLPAPIILPAAILLYLGLAHFMMRSYKWNYDRLVNPVTAFLQSVNPMRARPALFTMQLEDSMRYKKPGPPKHSLAKNDSIKNVLLFVFESVPAEYIDSYGGQFNATPVLKRYNEQSLLFKNVYAHAPATNLSMVSMLNSIYPWLSYNSLTEEHPDLAVPSITSELKSRGYRTAFFNSADNRYQKAGEFLEHRRFDKVTDCRDNSCNSQFEVNHEGWDYMNGKEDACTGTELSEWISSEKNRPFFSVMWTYQTHYPYFNKGQLHSYTTADTMLNRYINALHLGDSILGNVLSTLKKEGLLRSTLVVVTGDHGEAFGRHDQVAHGRKIYEENLHVPFVLINPAFKHQEFDGTGGLVDVAPTIMHLLGEKQPQEWEGQTLFEKTKNSSVYFFAPWSDHLFGYRQGNYKYIYNATRDETEVYDLSSDPLESKNLAEEQKENIVYHHQRLASWAQYVNRVTGELLQRKQNGDAILADK
jgi:lipoteichoic acid synthase